MPGVPAGAGGGAGGIAGQGGGAAAAVRFAAGAGGLPAAPPPPRPTRTYVERFSAPEYDVYQGDYAGIHAAFDVAATTGGVATTPAQLMLRAVAWATRPASLAYVALADRGTGPVVETYVNPLVHSDLPGRPASGQTRTSLGSSLSGTPARRRPSMVSTG